MAFINPYRNNMKIPYLLLCEQKAPWTSSLSIWNAQIDLLPDPSSTIDHSSRSALSRCCHETSQDKLKSAEEIRCIHTGQIGETWERQWSSWLLGEGSKDNTAPGSLWFAGLAWFGLLDWTSQEYNHPGWHIQTGDFSVDPRLDYQ